MQMVPGGRAPRGIEGLWLEQGGMRQPWTVEWTSIGASPVNKLPGARALRPLWHWQLRARSAGAAASRQRARQRLPIDKPNGRAFSMPGYLRKRREGGKRSEKMRGTRSPSFLSVQNIHLLRLVCYE